MALSMIEAGKNKLPFMLSPLPMLRLRVNSETMHKWTPHSIELDYCYRPGMIRHTDMEMIFMKEDIPTTQRSPCGRAKHPTLSIFC
jgi:hypothetical protein